MTCTYYWSVWNLLYLFPFRNHQRNEFHFITLSEKYIENFSLNSYYASLEISNGYTDRSLGFSVYFLYLYITWNIIKQSLYLTSYSDENNFYIRRFLGFSVYISNTINKEDGVLCFRDTNYTNATMPNPVNITCP